MAEYGQVFASPEAILDVFALHARDIADMFSPGYNKPWNRLLVIFIAALSTALLVIRPLRFWQDRMVIFFLLTAVFSYLAVNFSHWSALNGRPMHYYSPAYFFLMLALLRSLQLAQSWIWRGLAACLGALSLVSSIVFIERFNLRVDERLTAAEAREFVAVLEKQTEEDIGLLASYWNAYLPSAYSPRIMGFATKYWSARNRFQLSEVMERPRLVLLYPAVGPNLPSTINLYDYPLRRSSEIFRFGDYRYAFYTSSTRGD